MTQAAKTKKIFDGRYEILSIVGRGARSVVYHARHAVSPSSEVALKVLLEKKGGTTSAERLRREALAMVSSRHKFVVRLDDFHSVGTLCYLSMEFAPQSDLRNYIRKIGGKLKINQAERYLKQCAEALSAVHKAGIVHRDVKPDNILVMDEKEIRLTDFGVAVLPGEETSIADLQSGVGTMNYMAPEIIEGKTADQRSDLYSLGVVFYEALSGVNPFENVPLAKQLEARRDAQVAPLMSLVPDVPEYLASIVHQAMSYEPQNRFPTARDLVQALLVNRSSTLGEQKNKKRAPGMRKAEGSASAGVIPDHTIADPASPKTIEQPLQKAFGDSGDATATQQFPMPRVRAAAAAKPAEPKPEESPKAKPYHPPTQEQLPADETVAINRHAVQKIQRPHLGGPAAAKFNGSRMPIIGALVFAGLLVGMMVMPPTKKEGTPARPNEQAVSAAEPVINQSSGKEFTFPELPSGMFAGTIKDLIPGKTLPLTLISFEKSDSLAVLIGMEGWTPTIVHPRRQVAQSPSGGEKRLRVASNGIIINLTGQNVDGVLFGYFVDLVTGVQGEWRAQPVN